MKSFESLLQRVFDTTDLNDYHVIRDGVNNWCLGTNTNVLFNHTIDNVSPVTSPEHFQALDSNSTKSGHPFARVSIANISLTQTTHPESSPDRPVHLQKLELQTDITTNVENMDQIFEFFPHLTVCSKIWILPEEEVSGPFCVRVDEINYHSTINTHFDMTQEDVLIHLWYQISESGGKIKDSDVYVPITLNAPHYNVYIFASGNKIPRVSIDCPVDSGFIFSFTPTYRASLQHATADFCQRHRLLETSCYQAVYQISKCIKERVTDWELPNIQSMPTPQDPFVFIHFEKVGGTSLRE